MSLDITTIIAVLAGLGSSVALLLNLRINPLKDRLDKHDEELEATQGHVLNQITQNAVDSGDFRVGQVKAISDLRQEISTEYVRGRELGELKTKVDDLDKRLRDIEKKVNGRGKSA